MSTQLKPIEGLQNLLKDNNVMGIIRKVEGALRVASSMYGGIRKIYRFANGFGKALGSPLPNVSWPNLHLTEITETLRRVNVRLERFSQDVSQLADDITGDIPGGAWTYSAVETRLAEIAKNMGSSSTLDSPEMKATVAFAAFHRNIRRAEASLTHGRHILGNASIALESVKNSTLDGSAVLSELAAALDKYHNYPLVVVKMMKGQCVFACLLSAWVIFYACARKDCLTDCVSKALYTVFHIILQLFVIYCIVMLMFILVVGVVYYGLAMGPCNGNFTDNKYSNFCEFHVFEMEAVMPMAFYASMVTAFLAYNILAVYTGMLSDHMQGADKRTLVKMEDSDEDDDEYYE